MECHVASLRTGLDPNDSGCTSRFRVAPNGFLGPLNQELEASAMAVLLDRGTGLGRLRAFIGEGGSGAVGVCCGVRALR